MALRCQRCYAYDALERIDARTMEIHHSKHHQAYVNNLNAAIEKLQAPGKSARRLMRGINTVPRPSWPCAIADTGITDVPGLMAR